MVALRDLIPLGDDLDRLAGALEDLRLTEGLSSLQAERDRLIGSIRHYLIPRTSDGGTPLTVVFAGPTGSGKSTLINSLAGLELSVAGPLRPTTTGPVILAGESTGEGLGTIAGIECELTVGTAPILDSMLVVDTPDIDSTSTDHRYIAETLIDHADLVVFVVSALRYADAVPWQVLRRAESRGAEVINVINRVGSSTRGAVVDFQRRLRRAGLSDELVVVPEHRLDGPVLPPVAVRSLRRQLVSLAGDRASSTERIFDRVLRVTISQAEALRVEMSETIATDNVAREEVAESLVARVGDLDLSGVGDGLVDRPGGQTTREVRRWLRSSRRGPLTKEEVEAVVGSIEDRLIRDLRIWMSELPDSAGFEMEPRRLLTGIAPIARLALEGWIDFVRRIALEEAPRSTGPAEAVLVATATRPSDTLAADILFGERAYEIVSRARRELVSRLEVIYEQAAAQANELSPLKSGVVDLSDLQAALASVRLHLALVDA